MNSFSRIKALISVYFIAAIDNIGYAMVFVLFPSLLFNPDYGFLQQNPTLTQKLFAMGSLYAAFPIAQLLGAPISGELADHYGRKKIFLISIFGTVLAYIFTGVILLAKSIWLLFIARFFTGLFSGNQGLCNASIADLNPDPRQRAKSYGIITVVWGLSFPFALILGGFLSNPSLSKDFSPSLPFYITSFLTTLSFITIILFFPETYKKTPAKITINLSQGLYNILEALRMPKTKRYFILMLVWTLGWGYAVTWYGAYAMKNFHISQTSVTLGFMVQGVGWTLGGAVANPLLLRLCSIPSIAKVSYSTTVILLLIAACMPTFYLFIVFFALSAISGSVSLSSTFNLISISSSSSVQGKAMGIAQSMISFGFFLVTILGAASGAISIYTFYPIAAFFLLMGFLILYKKTRE